MKKLLICGGTGFIGRNLIDYYVKKNTYEIFATYHKTAPPSMEEVTFVNADLTNRNDVQRVMKGMDIVIQAAATTSGANEIVNKPYYHVTDNAVMNSLILREAFECKVDRLLFFSCTVMYQPDEKPRKETDYKESDELFPNYFGAGWTKVYIEKMCQFYSQICDTKFTVFRHSNIYGPYDKYDLERSHVFGATVTKVMQAEEGTDILIWGEGKEKRDLLYVEDLIEAVDLALEKQESKYELVNIGYGEAISISELVEKIIHISGKQLKINYDQKKPSIPMTICLDCGKARELYGWKAKTDIETGIRKTLVWYKETYQTKGL